MPRRQNSFSKRAILELANGNVMHMYLTGVDYGPGHPENDCEQSFELNGIPVDRKELPAEVTDEVIEELIHNAERYDYDDS